jgi:hypothetical protein
MVMAERGAGGQQHLEDAKEGLLEREGQRSAMWSRGEGGRARVGREGGRWW